MFCRNCGKSIDVNASFCSYCGANTTPSAFAQQPQSSTEYHISTKWTRLANWFLDYIGSFIVAFILFFIYGFAMGVSGAESADVPQGTSTIISILVMFCYYLFSEWLWGRTPAKFLTKCKVVMKDGSKPDFMHILGRTFARIIPFDSFAVLIRGFGWHDSLSGTMVVPSSYTPEQVQQIQPRKEKSSTGLIIGIVIALVIIIPLLASVVLLALNSARTKSRDAKRVADIRQIQTAVELYAIDHNQFPKTLAEVYPQYLSVIPTAPDVVDGNCTPDNNTYKYSLISTDQYKIQFCLGYETGGLPAGVNTISAPSEGSQPSKN